MTPAVLLGLQEARETLLHAESRAHGDVCRLRAELKRAEEDLADYRRAHENVVAALEEDLSPLLQASLDALPPKFVVLPPVVGGMLATSNELPSGTVLCAGAPMSAEKKK